MGIVGRAASAFRRDLYFYEPGIAPLDGSLAGAVTRRSGYRGFSAGRSSRLITFTLNISCAILRAILLAISHPISLALLLALSSDGRVDFAILLVCNYTRTNKLLDTSR